MRKLGRDDGWNRVRFSSPVPGYQASWEVTMECAGAPRPACIAENAHRRYG